MKPIYAWPLVIASAVIMFGGTYLYNANKVHPVAVKPVVHQPVAPKVIVKQQTQETASVVHATPHTAIPNVQLDPMPDTTPKPYTPPTYNPKTCKTEMVEGPYGFQNRETCSDGTQVWR